MNPVIRIVQRLRSLADMLPLEERPTFMPGVATEAIAAIEECLPAPLPADFADFLRACESVRAMDVHNGYWIGDVAGLMRNVGRGGFPAFVPYDDGPVAVLPVATDGGGNAFLLSLDGDRVWKWDHETGRVRPVAASFADYLRRVHEDWEHYLSGDDWQYLSG